MTATTSSAALATIQPAFTGAERLALAGFWPGTAADAADFQTSNQGPDRGHVSRRGHVVVC